MTVIPDAVIADDEGQPSSVVQGLDPQSVLAVFNRAGILAPADVHVARCLARLTGETDDTVILGAAFAVRAPRKGHVYADLRKIRDTATSDEEGGAVPDELPWPDSETWISAMGESNLVASDPDEDSDRPLVLEDSAIYLNRLWRDEVDVAKSIRARAASTSSDAATTDLGPVLGVLFPGDSSDAQRKAAITAMERRFSVIAGGPGTGKTTTVARLLAALFAEAERRGDPFPAVALAAPTGKAAARMAEAVRTESRALQVSEAIRQKLGSLEATTVHRLLGSIPGVSTRFRYNRWNQLPHDLVVIDETSMLALWLMARLSEAVRDDARLVLVGDPEQLTSVEAGVVLADVCGPAVDNATDGTGEQGPLVGCVVSLSRNYRFSGQLAELADAIRVGEADRTFEILAAASAEIEWMPAGSEALDAGARIEELALEHARRLIEIASSGSPEDALEAASEFRVLCAHRRGETGASTWNARIEDRIGRDARGGDVSGFFAGRPVIVTANDYSLRLFNGDVGMVVPRDYGGLVVAFRPGSELMFVGTPLLSSISSVYAMTIHKAQGSEFDEVAIVLPDPDSRVLSRELLYTALTRAKKRVRIFGSEESLRAGIERRVARASGLRGRLWVP